MAKNIVVTTCDLQRPYDIICPVSHTVSTNLILEHLKKYKDEDFISLLGIYNEGTGQMESLYCDVSYGSPRTDIEQFRDYLAMICSAELRMKAAKFGGDAVIGMRMNTEYDRYPHQNGGTTISFQMFTYLQMYGTAVKRKA